LRRRYMGWRRIDDRVGGSIIVDNAHG
jgi:hypothetical protein